MFVDPSHTDPLFGTSPSSLEGTFGNHSVQKGQVPKNKPEGFDLFDTSDDDLFSMTPKVGTKKSDDLFAFTSSKKASDNKSGGSLFDDDFFGSSDQDLFSSANMKKKEVSKKSTAASSLFDMDDDDLFSSTPNVKKEPSKASTANVGSLFGEEEVEETDVEGGGLFGIKFEEDLLPKPKAKKISAEQENLERLLQQETPIRTTQTPPQKAKKEHVTQPQRPIESINPRENLKNYLSTVTSSGTWPRPEDLKSVSKDNPSIRQDIQNGTHYQMDTSLSEEEHITHFATDQALRSLGAHVPTSTLIKTEEGYVRIAEIPQTTPLSEVLATASEEDKKALLGQIKEQFPALALLGIEKVGPESFGVDADGKVWILDTTGALQDKSPHPVEFWSMRSPTQENSQELFGDLSIYAIASSVDGLASKSAAMLEAIPPGFRPIMAKRLASIQELSTQALAMERDNFKPEYTDRMLMHRMGLRHTGISRQLPNSLRQGDDKYTVVDENNKTFDSLRFDLDDMFSGKKSVTAQVADYMVEQGSKPEVISSWMRSQAGNSWSEGAQAAKFFWAQQRDLPEEAIWWQNGALKAESVYQRECQEHGGKAIVDDAFTIWHAYTQELLASTDFPNNDRANGTTQLIRTEDKVVLREHGITEIGTYPRIPSGTNESSSIFASTAVMGAEVTLQTVPHHAITATYFIGSPPDGASCPFLKDEENEFLFMPQGINMRYIRARSVG